MGRITAICCLVFLWPTGALGAASTAPGAIYAIDVLVFENRLPQFEGGELWTLDTVSRRAGDSGNAIVVANASPGSALSQAEKILAADGNYRILAHKRWLQNAEAKSTSQLIRLDSAGGELDGTMRFYLSRFLHVDLDLTVTKPAENGFFVGTAQAPDQVYRLSEQRRVRTQEINYFDHPKFGALIRVDRVRSR